MKLTKEGFASERIDAMCWPVQSLDLYPVENIWVDVKRVVATASLSSKTQVF